MDQSLNAPLGGADRRSRIARPACASVLTLLASFASAAPSVPERNLLVEIRSVDVVEHGSAPPGSVVVSTAGNIDAQGSVTLRAGSRQQADAPIHRIPVLNGHRASIKLMETVPLVWVDVASGASRGANGASGVRGGASGQRSIARQGWTEAGSAFSVLPRWPGGAAPVTVDIEQARSDAPDGESGGRHESLVTTLRLPMNVWETVAQDGAERDSGDANTVSTRDVGGAHRHAIQIRISAP